MARRVDELLDGFGAAVIVDTSVLLAYFDAAKPDDEAVCRVIDQFKDALVVAPYVVAELDGSWPSSVCPN